MKDYLSMASNLKGGKVGGMYASCVTLFCWFVYPESKAVVTEKDKHRQCSRFILD